MILNKDRSFPNQKFNSHLYNGNSSFMNALHLMLGEHAKFKTFRVMAHERVTVEEMSTPPLQLALLKFLIDLTSAKTFLEIGTFIGTTSMHVAEFMGKDGHVTTIEKFKEFASIARDNFADNHLSDRIKLIEGDAVEAMKSLKNHSFDIIYIDGDKGKYLDLALIAEQKISPKGLIIVDDVFFHGDVFNDHPKTAKGKGCKALLEHYKNTKKFSKYILPIHNGILLLRKL